MTPPTADWRRPGLDRALIGRVFRLRAPPPPVVHSTLCDELARLYAQLAVRTAAIGALP